MWAAQPVCKGCGQPIAGNYLTALGVTWHPEHFLCAACGLPIGESSFQLHQGSPYHTPCYVQRIAPRCAYCGKPLVGEYLIDHWGTRYCKEHQQEYPSCAYCGRLVAPQQQEPGLKHGDTVRCPVCRSSAIEDMAEAKPLYQQVKQWIGHQGLVYNSLPLKLDLCGPTRLAALSQGSRQIHALGATFSSMSLMNERVVNTEVSGVAVLRGLPA